MITSLLLGQVVHGGETVRSEVPGGIGGTGSYDSDVPEGLYLHDSTGSRSLITQLATTILADNPDLTTLTITLQRDRLLRLEFDVECGLILSTTMRQILGFDTDLSGSDTYTADRPSTYLWAPAMAEQTDGRLGKSGIPVWDAQWAMGGGNAPPTVTRHNFHRRETLSWDSVANDRIWVDETGGEFFAFWRDCLSAGRRFCHYRQITMDEASSTAVTLSSRVGPYCMAPPNGRVEFPYVRTIRNVEFRNNVSIPAVIVTEI